MPSTYVKGTFKKKPSTTPSPRVALAKLEAMIPTCRECPRLVEYCATVAQEKRRSYQGEAYWGRPVPGFGAPDARVVIVGLAPAAHGANRTGRVFTGDRSGEWLYRALHESGFANQPASSHRDDGLKLQSAYVTCAVHCAPPGNKPDSLELKTCIDRHLKHEIAALTEARVYIALGKIAYDAMWPLVAPEDARKPKFAHGEKIPLPGDKYLLLSYHPSQQNTFTGVLTWVMFERVFRAARLLSG